MGCENCKHKKDNAFYSSLAGHYHYCKYWMDDIIPDRDYSDCEYFEEKENN